MVAVNVVDATMTLAWFLGFITPRQPTMVVARRARGNVAHVVDYGRRCQIPKRSGMKEAADAGVRRVLRELVEEGIL